eukprot:TRINITY_DN49107_c0_g1_i1.p1 TRINITY_DN49107_c0_g1~~TRINITY_DN49107_c0_g1_i1.p1  ORF type:complete len:152 (-),score=18.17 TRINITY_DN49107_c0_g1_i1:33-467(-)
MAPGVVQRSRSASPWPGFPRSHGTTHHVSSNPYPFRMAIGTPSVALPPQAIASQAAFVRGRPLDRAGPSGSATPLNVQENWFQQKQQPASASSTPCLWELKSMGTASQSPDPRCLTARQGQSGAFLPLSQLEQASSGFMLRRKK